MEYINKSQVWAVVIWYNPSIDNRNNIQLYQKDVEGVIVVDNSESDNSKLLDDSSIIYLPQYKNLGIAAALNIGCKEAIRHGAHWILTMDQDSKWNQHTLREYIAEANTYPQIEHVGIFSPYHDCDGKPETHHRNGRYELKMNTMCSGNLLNINAWKQTNGFREDFFIDLVDDEICCHIRQIGLQVIVLNNILLTHRLGNGIQHSKLLRRSHTSHPVWRYYYIARNIHIMISLYPDRKKYYRSQVFKYIKRICLYHRDHKLAKLQHFYRGWKDACSLLH